MKRLLTLAALILSLAIPSPVEAQKRTRKRPPKISQEEAMASAELEHALQSEFEAVRKIDPVRRSVITIPIDSLIRACQIYKVTGEFRRAETEFYTDATAKGFNQAMESLPEGFLKSSMTDAVSAFSDASKLYQAYYGLEEVSNYKILEIVRSHDLEDVPRASQVSTLMSIVVRRVKEVKAHAGRLGLPVSEN